MTSLRESVETFFAAAAFAECNLPQEARDMMRKGAARGRVTAAKRSRIRDTRPRPTLKA